MDIRVESKWYYPLEWHLCDHWFQWHLSDTSHFVWHPYFTRSFEWHHSDSSQCEWHMYVNIGLLNDILVVLVSLSDMYISLLEDDFNCIFFSLINLGCMYYFFRYIEMSMKHFLAWKMGISKIVYCVTWTCYT